MASIKVDDSELKALFNDLRDMPELVMKETFPYYKSQTPIRSGNARNKTKRKGLTIKSDYGYAGPLDDGWSKQSPKGFTDPSIDKLEGFVENYIKRVS
tara:strand:- start:47 stop:340 length:294 start_codon:yes stop_codon:yes gene_type:complete